MHQAPPPRALNIHIITVSTSRNASSDRSGPVLKSLAEGAGHQAAGPVLVVDDPALIGKALDAALSDIQVEAVLLTGGTGISARDCTPVVVRQRLERELPGFGEIFRMLSFQEVGSAAMLSNAIGGIAKGKPVFAMPGSPKACTLAMEKLILPQLGHLLEELHKETPLPTTLSVAGPASPAVPAAPVPEASSSRVQVQSAETPMERPSEPEIASGWLAAKRALGASNASFDDIPEPLQKWAAVMDVLNSAGERAAFVLPDGRKYLAFGYPDLVKNASKVLWVRESSPLPEIVALHRWPNRVGICGGEEGILPSCELSPEAAGEGRVERAYPGNGTLFALEGGAIYVTDGRKVSRWDGSREGAGDVVSRAVASMILGWSQR